MTLSLLIVGGAGFIGSHLTRYLSENYPNYRLIHLDKLLNSGSQENVKSCRQLPMYFFEHGDALIEKRVVKLFQEFDVRGVIYLAEVNMSETTLAHPKLMIDNNIEGVLTVLDVARQHWMTPDQKPKLGYEKCAFHLVSTAHVYGPTSDMEPAHEDTLIRPLSLYASSLAGAELLAQSYHQTYGMNISVSRLCHVFGPGQSANRFIPATVSRLLADKNVTIKGKTLKQSWLYIDDCVRALDSLYHHAKPGNIYNVGSDAIYTNLEIARAICSVLDIKKPLPNQRRYDTLLRLSGTDTTDNETQIIMDNSRIQETLGWTSQEIFEVSLIKTIDDYLK